MVVIFQSRSLYLYCSIAVLFLLSLLAFAPPRQAVAQFGQHVADNIVSLASSASTCPNPHLTTSNLPTSPSVSVEALPSSAECVTLPTISDNFTISACRHKTYCNALDLIITRKDASLCSEMEESMRKSPVSDDPQLTDYVRNVLGPDAFMIIVDGSERMARWLPDAYLGGCSYRFSLRFNNAGPVSLQIWHHFDRYFAYWETNEEWPPQATERVLLPNPLFFEPCPSCHSWVAPPAIANATLLPLADAALDRKPCSVTEPIYGSYIPASYLETHSVPNFYEPLPANQNAYKFAAAGDCQFVHAGLRYVEHAACFALPETRVLLHGDSHQRVIYDAIVHRLEGNQWTLTDSEKSGHKNASFTNRYLDFYWDPTGDGMLTLDCNEIQSFDVLGFSIGHHLYRLTTAKYTEFMTRLFESVTKLSQECPTTSGRKRHLVYITPPAVAPREDEFVREIKDRRTNPRMINWTAIGLDLARKYGWRSVDQFHYTTGFVRDVKDNVHFLETDGLDPVVDDVIAKLGICDLPQV